MAILNIPVKRGASSWTQRMQLDGIAYILDFAWNGRDAAWYMGISDSAGNPLLLSRKIASNNPILRRFRFVAGLPAGEFFANDPAGETDYPGYDDLGATVKLLYFEKAELA